MEIENPRDFLEKQFLSNAIKYSDNKLLIFGREGVMINMGWLVKLTKHLVDEEPSVLEQAAYDGSLEPVNDYDRRNAGENSVLFSINVLSAAGFGLAHVNKNGDNISVNLEGCALATVYLRIYGKNDNPVCHIIRGILRRIFDTAYGTSGEVIELDCVAQGKTNCSFLYKSSKQV